MDRQNSQENSPGEPLSGSRTRLVRDEPQAQSWRRRIRRTNHVEESLDSALPTVSSERRPHPMRSLPARPISRHITTLVSAQNSTGTSSNSSNPGQVSQIPSQNSSQSRPTESHQSSSDGLHLSLVFDQKSESNSSIDAENRYAEPNVGRQASVGSEESGANSNAVTTATNGTSSSGWTTASTVRLAHRWTTVHRRSSRLTDLLPPEERHSSGLQAPTRLLVTDPNDRVRLQSDLQSNYESVDQSKGEDDQDEDQNDSAGDRSRLVYRPPEIIYTPNRRRSSSLAPPDAEAFILGRKRSKSPRRNSQVFLMGDDTLLMQFDGGKRRLSSFFSTSSNEETVVNMEEGGLTEEEILETLKTHRQIIAHTKTQHWPMHRKLKVLRRAKMYLKKHEGDMKQSSQAKDILATYRSYIEKLLHRLKREIDNLIVILTPWEMRIKKIESQFGSVVASYFMFLRWIFWINTFIGIAYVAFVMVPEILLDKNNMNNTRGMRKIKEEVDKPFLTTISEINEFDGFLKFSPIFYGYYDTEELSPTITKDFYYPLPLTYFVITLLLFSFSFVLILRKMARNARLQRIGTKDDELVFCMKLFTGWDYMIGNSETAHNKVASIVMGFKEVILEEKEKKKEVRNWRLIAKRILANILILIILCSSAYAVVLVVERSQSINTDNFFERNEVNFVFAGLQSLCPTLFNVVSILEENHPRIALRWQLARILVLNILNFVCLLLSTFQKVETQTKQLKEIKDNLTLLHRFELQENLTHLNDLTTEALDVQSATFVSVVRKRRQEGEGRMFPPEKVNRSEIAVAAKPAIDQNLLESYYEDPIEGRQIQPKKRKEYEVFDSGGGDKHLSTPVNASKRTSSSTVSSSFSMKPTISPSLVMSSVRPLTSTFTPPSTLFSSTARTRPSRPYRPFRGRPVATSTTTSTTTPIPTTTIDADYDDPSLMNYTVSLVDLSAVREWNTTTDLNIDLSGNATSGDDVKPMSRYPMVNDTSCKKEPEKPTDPFLLFQFAQKLEQQGYENYTSTLKGLCWETSFGQELVKLTLTDLYMNIISTIFNDYLRAVLVRYCNGWPCICCDLEMRFPGYPDFAIAENILSLVNSQGLIWLGMFFAPGLPAINTIKLCILMYLKSWAVLTSNIPHETVFKASGSNNFYFGLLLLMLFLSCLPVAYCVVWFEPSWHCGPFSNQANIYHILTRKLEAQLPTTVNRVIDYICSPALIIPLLMFMMLIIYYMSASLTSLKDANADLKAQLRKDRDEPIASPTEKKHVRIDETSVDQQSKDK